MDSVNSHSEVKIVPVVQRGINKIQKFILPQLKVKDRWKVFVGESDVENDRNEINDVIDNR